MALDWDTILDPVWQRQLRQSDWRGEFPEWMEGPIGQVVTRLREQQVIAGFSDRERHLQWIDELRAIAGPSGSVLP